MSLLQERDLARVGRDAREWLIHDRDLVRRGRQAGDWLRHDERGRVIGMVVFSIAISIIVSLMATALVGFVSRRRAAVPVEPAVGDPVGEPLAAVEAPGVPVMDVAEPTPSLVESHVEA
jgi:hypothetical protein